MYQICINTSHNELNEDEYDDVGEHGEQICIIYNDRHYRFCSKHPDLIDEYEKFCTHAPPFEDYSHWMDNDAYGWVVHDEAGLEQIKLAIGVWKMSVMEVK